MHARPSPDQLAHFAVFDRECEKDIVDERGEATFTPPMLKRYDELGLVVEEVKRRIAAEGQATRPTDDLQDLMNLVKVSQEISDLLAWVKLDQTDEKYRQITESVNKISWGSDRDEKLKDARTKLLAAGDPAAKAKAMRGLAGSLKTIRKAIEDADLILGEPGEITIRVAMEHALALASAAAQAEAGVDFTKEPALNIGSPTWQHLYIAAISFALEGFSTEPRFPAVDAKCPMCLQDLDATAQDRMRRFKAFMSKEAKVASDNAKADLDGLIETITACALPAADPHIAQQAAEQTAIHADLITGISAQLTARREQLLRNVSAAQWVTLPAFPTDAMAALRAAETQLEVKAQETEKLADPTVRAALENEVKTFEAVQAFAAQRERVLKVVSQYAKAAGLGRIASEINTRSISIESKAVAERAVTAGLKAAFVQEMKHLGADGIVPADINPTATKGKTTFGIVLTGTTQNAKVGNVLSEGEQRVIALAYFLAEVQASPDKISIILDDPVSSLDYHWEDRISKRIAELATDRQVIVFTHSVSLVLGLENHAKETRAKFNRIYIEKTSSGAGRPLLDGAPFSSLSVSDRIKHFKNVRLPILRAEYGKSPTGSEYTTLVAQLGGQLRSAWERAVEELIFCDVIKRFGNTVHTKMLKKVVCTTDAFKMVNAAMSQFSGITDAHDTPIDGPSSYPNPDEFSKLIDALDGFVEYQRKQSKIAEDERKLFEKTASPSPM